MNKSFLVLLLGISIAPCDVSAQGVMNVGNSPTTRFSTNALAIGATAGLTAPAAGPWYFELLTAPSFVVNVDPSLQSVLSAPWSDTGVLCTNTGLPGRLNGGNAGTAVANFWPAGQTNTFLFVGWSGNLGSSWAVVASKLFGASLAPGAGTNFFWTGGQLDNTSDGMPAYLGATTLGFRQAGGVVGSFTIPSPGLFSGGPDGQGNPVTTPSTLWVTIPEPSVLALGFSAITLVFLGKRLRV